jgi:hypothetical protein
MNDNFIMGALSAVLLGIMVYVGIGAVERGADDTKFRLYCATAGGVAVMTQDGRRACLGHQFFLAIQAETR